MGVVASEAIRQKLHTDKIGTQVVLIGTWQTDGSVAIGAVVESCTVVNAALASYYSSNKDAIVAHAAATHKVTGDVNMLINSIKAKQTDAVT